MIIKGVSGKEITDSRNETTIEVSVRTSAGSFSASSPTGKSTGKHEKKPYGKDVKKDVKALKDFSDYFSKDIIDKFDDVRRVEDIMDGHIGANTLFALEACVLRALASEQKKQVWQLINPKAKKSPRLVGNCVGGGKHTGIQKRKPDFQEFLLIPKAKTAVESWETNKNLKNQAKVLLKDEDGKFQGRKNDEDAWITSLNDREILDVFGRLKGNNFNVGIDAASSGFFRRKKYRYSNPKLDRTENEHFEYVSNLIRNFGIFYVEDPFHEEDFRSFAELLKRFPKSLITGDDLTVTNANRLKKAVREKSVNAIIVKPNQTGSLLEVAEVCKIAQKNGIKTVFSHRSGETRDDILADLAFGFGADFLKCGITGKGREEKMKRLTKIESEIRRR